MRPTPSLGDTCTPEQRARFSSYRQAFLRDGAVHIPQALGHDDLQMLEDAFQWKLDNAGAELLQFFGGQFVQAIGGHGSTEVFRRVLRDTCIGDIAAALFGSGPVWFVEEQVFYKQAGPHQSARRSAWHQDASYQPFAGSKNLVIWVSFEPLSREEALEVVRGSHLGPVYNGIVNDAEDDTKPGLPEEWFPRVPQIEADRASWDIVSWAYTPGDVLVFHPKTLHGGAPCLPGKSRRSMALRFFGDDVLRIEHPGAVSRPTDRSEDAYMGEFVELKIGEPASRVMPGSVRPWTLD